MDKVGQRRILLVEDDAGIREMVVMALTTEGYAVQCAPDGAAALALIEHSPPDVILLDMKLPVMDGWAFAALYEQQLAARAPVIVLTAAADAARRAAEIGAAGYLSKPFDLDELLDLIARHTA